MNNSTNLFYQGTVNVKLNINGRIVELSDHNNGCPALRRSFCKFVTGNASVYNDTPQFLTIKVSTDNWATSTSFLKSPISITGKEWQPDEESDYVAKFRCIVTNNDLSETIYADDSSRSFRLYLISGSGEDMAYLDIDATKLSQITPGTQAIIEWSMRLYDYNGGE